MKNVISIVFVACLVVAFACSVVAEDAETPVAVEITGQNVNVAKTLCGEEGQELDETYGGLNALVVKEAVDADGNAIDGMAGKMLHYLPVAAASKLIAGEENLGKTVTVKGKLYKNAAVIAVTEFTVEAAETDAGAEAGDDWDDWDELEVKTMSQQQVI